MNCSVIIPSYRRPKLLLAALTSLSEQSRSPDEVVVVLRDDDVESRDALEAVSWDRVKIVFIHTPGIVAAENYGLKFASGDVACFMDDDAVADSTWISRIMKHFETDSCVGAVGGPCPPVLNGHPVLETTNRVGYVNWFGYSVGNHDKIPDRLLKVRQLRGCNMAFRREILGQFDGNLVGDCYRFETDATLRVTNHGYVVYFDPAIIVHHYVAPRFDGNHRIGLQQLVDYNRNNTYVMLKNLGVPNKIAFLLFTFLVGDRHCPGFVRYLKRLITAWDGTVFQGEIVPSVIGKIRGIGMYIAYLVRH